MLWGMVLMLNGNRRYLTALLVILFVLGGIYGYMQMAEPRESVEEPTEPTPGENEVTLAVVGSDDPENAATLDFERPVLFVGYWCGHCSDYLEDLSKKEEFPPLVIVSLWPEEDTHQEVVDKTELKLEEAGLSNQDFWLLRRYPEWLKFVPTLAYLQDGEIMAVSPFELDEEQEKAVFGQ